MKTETDNKNARDLAATVTDAQKALANLEGAANGSSEWRAEYRQDIATVKRALAALEQQAADAQDALKLRTLERDTRRSLYAEEHAARVRAEEALRQPPEQVARLFHEAYERLAPSFGYETREQSAVPWEDVPEPNKSLMVAVAGEVIATLATAGAGE